MQSRFRWSRAGLALTVLMLTSAAACGDKITYLECPPGTVPEGSQCVPFTPQPDVEDTGTTEPDVVQPTDVQPEFPTVDLGVPDADPELPGTSDGAVSDADPGDSTGTGDVPATEVAPSDPTGQHCSTTADCNGGTCLGWPSGYCTQLDCTPGSCSAGSECMELAGGNTACLRSCDSLVDCLTDGTQGCKALPMAGADTTATVCHGVDSQAGEVGELCDGDLVCAGEATCLATIPGGYCGIVDCDDTSCPAGAACVKFDGTFTCMATCGIDEHCPSGPEAERKCAELKAPDLSLQKVCIAGGSGKPIGDACVGGVECDSGVCEILGAGRCSQTNGPCDTEADCNGAEFCVTGPDKIVGVCAANCAVGVPCPGASHCTGLPGASTGVCRPACTGITDTASCPADAGFTCTYGYPLGDSTGQGKYVCFRPDTPGPIGTPCAGGGECASGICGASGLCEDTCGADYFCPFPGSCVAGPTVSGCLKGCFSSVDCPAGTSCGQPQGSLNKVCE